MGLTYYVALYYSMAVGHAAVEAGDALGPYLDARRRR